MFMVLLMHVRSHLTILQSLADNGKPGFDEHWLAYSFFIIHGCLFKYVNLSHSLLCRQLPPVEIINRISLKPLP